MVIIFTVTLTPDPRLNDPNGRSLQLTTPLKRPKAFPFTASNFIQHQISNIFSHFSGFFPEIPQRFRPNSSSSSNTPSLFSWQIWEHFPEIQLWQKLRELILKKRQVHGRWKRCSVFKRCTRCPTGELLAVGPGGFHSHGGTPIAGWFSENPIKKWMMTRGTSILGNPHIPRYSRKKKLF